MELQQAEGRAFLSPQGLPLGGLILHHRPPLVAAQALRSEVVLRPASDRSALRSLRHVWNVNAEGTRVGPCAACVLENRDSLFFTCPQCQSHSRAPEGLAELPDP